MGNENGAGVEKEDSRQSWYLIKFPLASNTTSQQSSQRKFHNEKK